MTGKIDNLLRILPMALTLRLRNMEVNIK